MKKQKKYKQYSWKQYKHSTDINENSCGGLAHAEKVEIEEVEERFKTYPELEQMGCVLAWRHAT